MEKVKVFFEKRAFGVCTYLGERMGISISSIRLFFIYASFMTAGSPVIIYLILAFWINMRKHFRMHRNPFSWEW
ncbi:MAG: PspC domain-containing protein [Microscillaceae bacterium]|nr:PspC domain-containing protein [Microscillaceae bacterium]MDW8460672.1 PspC domain-containing protein [Cytophagales bacterium]